MGNFRNAVTGSIDALDEAVTLGWRHFENGGVGVQITGTFSAGLRIEGTIDSTTWVPLAYLDVSTVVGAVAGTTNITAPGIYRTEAVGFAMLRVRAAAYTGGTAVVTVVALPD